MLRVSDIMTPDVVTLGPEHTLREAVDVLVRGRITGAPVVAGGRVLGVVSTLDILEFAAASPGVPTSAPAQWDDWEVELLEDPEADEMEAVRYYTDLWSDVGGDVLERFGTVGSPEWDRLAEHTVSEIMTTRVAALSSDTVIDVAADRMLAAGIHRLLVLDGARLVGVVSSTDFVQVVAGLRR